MAVTTQKADFGLALRELRERKGLRLGEVARHLGVAVSYLSNVELGREAPLSPERIDALCALLDVDPTEMQAAAAFARRRFTIESPSSTAVREALVGLQREPSMTDTAFFELIERIRKSRGLSFKGFQVRGIKTSPASSAVIDQRAGFARSAMELPSLGRLDMLAIFESLGRHTVPIGTWRIPLQYCVDGALRTEGEARFRDADNVIEVAISDACYADLEVGKGRAAFCVAHELGHVFMHTQLLLQLACLPEAVEAAGLQRASRDHKPYEDTEWQANSFAGGYLMPARDVVEAYNRAFEDFDTARDDLSRSHGVSVEAAGIRLRKVCGGGAGR